MLPSKEQWVSGVQVRTECAYTCRPLNAPVFVGQALASRLGRKKSQSKLTSVLLKLSSLFLSLFPYLICFLSKAVTSDEILLN